MEKRIVEVTSITMQPFEEETTSPIAITFHYESKTVRYSYYSKDYGHYHINENDIEILQNQFPELFPDHTHFDEKIDWGNALQQGLYDLMKDELLELVKKERNSTTSTLVKYKWIGDPWKPIEIVIEET